mmetsp:Transcript_126196/g.356897  ORF Transcript_126196/g.356897 Transcript_126196/m.356897 type:complete len:293 (-) Transcript_126196:128-1006(-)
MMGKGMMGKGMMGKGMMDGGMMDGGKKGGGKKGCCKGKGGGKGPHPGGEAVGTKIFAGALPKSCTQESVHAYFSQFGNVVNVDLKYGPDGLFRGFGFITFDATETVQAVLDNYEHNAIEGKWVDCKPAAQQEQGGGSGGPKPPSGGAGRRAPSGTMLRMRGMPFQASPQDILQFFGELSPMRITTTNDVQGRPSGEALVEFADQESCVQAFNTKQGESMGKRYIELFGASQEEASTVHALETWSREDEMGMQGWGADQMQAWGPGDMSGWGMQGYGSMMGGGGMSGMRSSPY